MSVSAATLFKGAVFAAGALVVVIVARALWQKDEAVIAPDSAVQVVRGKDLYAAHCATCHGVNLEGQPNWRERLPNGRMPAPPHDTSGHTWHHPDDVLFGITKEGLSSRRYAPRGYQSDMPAFAGVLADDEIRALLAYIKSTWPAKQRNYQRDIDRRTRSDRVRGRATTSDGLRG